MDDLNVQLLDAIQTSVPLVADPWRLLADELGVEEEDVLRRVTAMRHEGVIRRIGGVFDATRLGYRQTLLALSVDAERLDRAAAVVAGHPGVSHCYSRSDEFNLWATPAVSPESTLGLETTLQTLASRCGAKAYLNLPVKQRFKLAVRFGGVRSIADPFGTKCGVSQTPSGRNAKERPGKVLPLSDEQRRAVLALQLDLSLEARPFDAVARKAGVPAVDELLVQAADLQAMGVLRRYSAVLHHAAAGAKANVLVAWRVPEDRAQLAGAAAAQHASVSHGYLRETAPDWPFNLYTMIHGLSRDDCLGVIHEIAATIGNPERRELWTIREYKKSPVQFFSPAEAEWEAQ